MKKKTPTKRKQSSIKKLPIDTNKAKVRHYLITEYDTGELGRRILDVQLIEKIKDEE